MATRAIALAAVLLASGCGVSTVEVESGLEKLRFYSNMHVVQAGDTLETVAFRYRLDTAELLALNPEARGGLRPGMRINVRPGTELASSVRDGARVAPGPGPSQPSAPTQTQTQAASSSTPGMPAAPGATASAPAPMPTPAPSDDTLLAPAPRTPTTIIATAPASGPSRAERLPVESARVPDRGPARMPDQSVTAGAAAPYEPASAPRDMAISEARWRAPTSAYPREEVIPDDLGPLPDEAGEAGEARETREVWETGQADRTGQAGQAAPGEALASYRPVPGAAAQADRAAQSASAGTGWVWPTAGQVARGFSPDRVDGQGIDIAGQPGQDVRAASAGTVVYSGKSLAGDGGNLVILRHADGLMTTYAHADRLFVTEDDSVRAGDPIASLGANEASESVLSFEVRRAGQAGPLDPLRFVSPE